MDVPRLTVSLAKNFYCGSAHILDFTFLQVVHIHMYAICKTSAGTLSLCVGSIPSPSIPVADPSIIVS